MKAMQVIISYDEISAELKEAAKASLSSLHLLSLDLNIHFL